jgi:hypothetical protein
MSSKYAPVEIRDSTSEFEVAVAKLVHAGISRSAAEGLMNRAVDRRKASLDQWADHLVQVRNHGVKVWSS